MAKLAWLITHNIRSNLLITSKNYRLNQVTGIDLAGETSPIIKSPEIQNLECKHTCPGWLLDMKY